MKLNQSKGFFNNTIFRDVFPYIALFVIAGAFVVPIGWAKSRTDDQFLPGVLVETFGFLMDVVFLGIFIVVFNGFRERKKQIERYKEEIDDYRGWNEKEATYRIVGLIRRLNKLKVYNIDLSLCFLVGSDLSFTHLSSASFILANLNEVNFSQINLAKANLVKANFSDAILSHAILSEANLIEAFLYNTILSFTDLSMAKLNNANLSFADLSYSNLSNADLSNVNFTKTNLSNANLSGIIVRHFGCN